MSLPLRFPRVWLGLGWSFVALAVLASLLPNDALVAFDLNDKLLHALGYCCLTIWFTGVYPRSRYLLIAALLLALGIGVEIAQGAMHVGRTPELRDVYANALGIGIGLTLALVALGGWAVRIETWMTRR